VNRHNLLIVISVAILTISIWALFNRPAQEPPWPTKIQGFSFSPMRQGQGSVEGIFPSREEIEEDIKLLAGKTNSIRTYTMESTLADIPEIAKKYDVNVALGAWIDHRLEKNEFEVNRLIEVAKANSNVVRVFVGNEVMLRGDISLDLVIGYIDRVRNALDVSVGLAEPPYVWHRYPELVEHVDFIGVHLLPYWEGTPLDYAVEAAVSQVNELKKAFPGKPIVIGEVGWPSNGRQKGGAIASVSNEATFLRRFLARALEEGYIYYIMEAFDQPWKMEVEGAVGAYWGVYDVDRNLKFPLSDPIVSVPHWKKLAVISVIVAAVVFAFMLIDSYTLKRRGRSFLAVVAFGAATTAVWIIYDYTQQYMTVAALLVGVLLVIGMLGVIVVLFTEAHEWAEAQWTKKPKRPFTPLQLNDEELPKVSVHVPAYNEPPDMMIRTLDALSRLDYPRFEVIVIDNNTKDPAVWKPVEEHCKKLGERFRFFHEDPLAGFKAGALNFALRHTAPDAEVIAVIDSDYEVTPDWLRDLATQFANPRIAIVQGPQDYRDEKENLFKAMCYAEYRGFFHIGMITRDQRNAIIQHGTMTMVRRKVLEEVDGWAQWCITEDAELGLKIFEKGYEAVYIPASYGKGLMPDTFTDFKKQRFRWAYGAVQILKRHARSLFLAHKSRLTYGQKYHFIAGWLPWIADSVNLLFNVAAMIWSLGMVTFPKVFDPPLLVFSIFPIALFVFKLEKLMYLYRAKVRTNSRQTFAAAIAGLSLSHTISLAILSGFFTKGKPFFRTPKMADATGLKEAMLAAREELLIASALWLSILVIFVKVGFDTLDIVIWAVMLFIQSLSYVAAVAVSVVSSFPALDAEMLGDMPPLNDVGRT